ncbi:MAG: DUF2089 family protein [Salinivirgaceae bacterium]|nr:DUF2089 family protein [Salinivirgaceae bacterium]
MKLPIKCPSCENKLLVKTLLCDSCETQVDGKYNLPELASLPLESQKFIIDFVKNSGSLKNMAKEMNLSYPSVRNRLDEVIKQLSNS